jgi:hypothetical protein
MWIRKELKLLFGYGSATELNFSNPDPKLTAGRIGIGNTAFRAVTDTGIVVSEILPYFIFRPFPTFTVDPPPSPASSFIRNC